MAEEEGYNIVISTADIIFMRKVSENVLESIQEEILDEIEDIDMVECRAEDGEISITTKFGDEWDFWQERLPKIDKIVKKHLE